MKNNKAYNLETGQENISLKLIVDIIGIQAKK